MRDLCSVKVRVVDNGVGYKVMVTRVTQLPANKYSERYMELVGRVKEKQGVDYGAVISEQREG